MIFYHNRKPNKMGFLKVLKSVGTSHFMHAAILTDQTESIETTRTKKKRYTELDHCLPLKQQGKQSILPLLVAR